MKNKYFTIRTMNLLLVGILLLTYQWITGVREKEEELALLNSKLANAEDTIDNVKNQLPEENATDGTDLYEDGTYTGEGQGFGGVIQVKVVIAEGSIDSVEILKADKEDEAYLDMAKGIVEDIIDQQTYEVDAASGATYSSEGIKSAVEDALEQAVKS